MVKPLAIRCLFLALLALLPGACSRSDGSEVLAALPHDPNAYTQGLLFHEGWFYESTGLRGRSSLRRVEPTSGKVLQQINLPPNLFGEGLTLFKKTLTQLTWQAGRAFVYDLDSFRLLREHRYDTEGWGLTHDGQSLIMSDGSHLLYYRDPSTFSLLRTVPVTENSQPVRWLNELEYINGEVWANVYRSPDIVRINPADGKIIARLSFPELPRPAERNGHEDVLNGIAYDAATQRVFITGKLFSYVYEISLPVK